ncbi:MAG: redox-regulated ATPase YchF [Candidatus Kerfeldbacteria bacterium]|nr:redox-regulated ATPase YchF [Candidatus Kerfeldbacteria bacterium]
MSLQIGIVGLPNVGKSTLFRALTKIAVPAENFPFCTIDPNVGVVAVPDERLAVLAQLVNTQKLVPATIEFVDIAGLVAGAHKGEGLGNQFLQHIREVDAIAEVVRVFKDDDVIHVAGSSDPVRDMGTIHFELVMADLQVVEKLLQNIEKKVRGQDKLATIEQGILQRLQKALIDGQFAHTVELTEDETEQVRKYSLLTFKPLLVVSNMTEGDMDAELPTQLQELKPVRVSAKIEAELSELPEEDAQMMMADLGMKESGLSSIIRAGYSTLNLMTYFTAGEKEVHAWTITRGMTAPQAAGKIHSDFEHKFIRAEVVAYTDFVEHDGWQGAKAAGKVRMEGKTYIVQDGDVMVFHNS